MVPCVTWKFPGLHLKAFSMQISLGGRVTRTLVLCTCVAREKENGLFPQTTLRILKPIQRNDTLRIARYFYCTLRDLEVSWSTSEQLSLRHSFPWEGRGFTWILVLPTCVTREKQKRIVFLDDTQFSRIMIRGQNVSVFKKKWTFWNYIGGI